MAKQVSVTITCQYTTLLSTASSSLREQTMAAAKPHLISAAWSNHESEPCRFKFWVSDITILLNFLLRTEDLNAEILRPHALEQVNGKGYFQSGYFCKIQVVMF